jgi:Lipopolysaccharide-assembly
MRLFSGILLLACAFGGGGCAGYHLGSTDGVPAGYRTIVVTPFTNRTLEPRMNDDATFALRKEIQRDGTFRLATGSSADIEITGELIRYERSEISFLATDTTTARDYRVDLTARVVARDRSSSKVMLDREVTGHSLMRVGSDLPSAERQTMPLVATDLARQITALLADGTW